MSDPHAAALDWIEQALREEDPQAHPLEVIEWAKTYHAIATEYDVPVEELIVWIHSDASAHDPTAQAWRQHAKNFAELQRRLGGRGAA